MSKRRNPMPAGYLNKAEKQIPVSVLNLAVLLHNLRVASKNPMVGFADANKTLSELTRCVNWRRIYVDKSVLESLLWSSNLLNEIGGFWHYDQLSFDEFLVELRIKFNKTYNIIGDK